MADIKRELTNYNRLGFARQVSATPNMTAERGRDLGAKYQKQLTVRAEKTQNIAKAVLGN